MKLKDIIISTVTLILLITLIGIFNYIDNKNSETYEKDNEIVYQENELDEIVFDGMTLKELAAKLDKSLKSDLAGTGYLYAKYSIEYGVDPYLAVAISLHETGCNHGCSDKVVDCNNVGGNRFSPRCYEGGTYGKYDTLEEGIKDFVENIGKNYIAKGLTTPLLMQDKYVGTGTQTWAPKVEIYMNKIKNESL